MARSGSWRPSGPPGTWQSAWVAQSVEQRTRNAQVRSSNLLPGSAVEGGSARPLTWSAASRHYQDGTDDDESACSDHGTRFARPGQRQAAGGRATEMATDPSESHRLAPSGCPPVDSAGEEVE